jgi:endogenous inhibitor of DNA gyrase (YacG/DUF329 family)
MSETERKVVPYRGAAKGGCPTCGKPAVARYRPFCSKRCADLDLHRWFAEGYRMPTDEQPADESAEAAGKDDED